MPVAEKTIRNTRVYREWKRGKGYKRLAKEYGLNSWETIRDIVKRHKKRVGR